MNPLEQSPEIYLEQSYIVLDFETTNSDNGSALNPDNRMVLGVWADFPAVGRGVRNNGSYKSRFASEYELAELAEDIRNAGFLVAHNAKFELQWLQRCGVDIHEVVVWDTMVVEKILLGNRRGGVSLAASCQRWNLGGKLPLGELLVHNGVSAEQVPESVLLEYCKQDVVATAALFRRQLKQVLEQNQLPLVFTHCLVTPVLADIEKNGMGLAVDRIEEEYERLTEQLAALDSTLGSICGSINLNSHKQMAEFLYETLGFKELKDFKGNPKRTASGQPATDAGTIGNLQATNTTQRAFIAAFTERQKVWSALSKTVSKLHEEVNKHAPSIQYSHRLHASDGEYAGSGETGRPSIRAAFHQTRTATGRLSSTGYAPANIQFHNLGRGYKRLFRAKRPGWLLGETDSAQIEFRVASLLGHDKKSFDDIVNLIDVHALTKEILGVSRQDAKPHTFKPLYGGTSGTKKEREYYQAFRERYPDIYKTQMGWVYSVLESGVLETQWGMRWYWDDTRVTNSGYITNTSSIFNYPIQALATAEVIPIALVYFWHEIHQRSLQMEIVNTVHDSIVCEVPPDEVEIFKQLSVECLTYRVYEYLERIYGIDFYVPLGVGIKIGEYWGEAEEEKIPLVYK